MKLFKSFKQIELENIGIINFFKDKTYFWAHTHTNKKNETLHEHISEVDNYFAQIIRLNSLESIIDNTILAISKQNDNLANFIKELFFLAIVFHDFGKTNPNFQHERLQNKHFKRNTEIKIGHEHSFLSVYFFLNYSVDTISRKKFSNEERYFAYILTFLFAIPVIKHHSGYLTKDYNYSEDKINGIQYLIELLDLSVKKENIKKLLDFEKSNDDKNLWRIFESNQQEKEINHFALFALLKLNYSLLTASDYLATSDYMNDIKLETPKDFGLITPDCKKQLFQNFDNNNATSWNGKLIKNPEKYLSKSLDDLQERNNDNLNFIRQKMGAEVLVNIEKNKTKKVFYIEAPTGGGKTNMSMLAVRKLLELNAEINKVFYVFPFTTLITQTAKFIKETFGLSDTDIAQIHSKAGFQEKQYEHLNEVDAHYGKERRNQIDNLFVNYPFALLTHIKFFDILKSNKKDTNYLLHRLANSVVIIDELQAYNPDNWDKIKYFVAQYAKLFNIRFVIMSATLPKIDEIELSDYKPKPFMSLIENAKAYLQNPNFSGRVEIKTDLLNRKIELNELASLVFEKSQEYAKNRTDKFNGSVYSIVEFIFKNSASEFYDEVLKYELENGYFFNEIFVLSGTILEPRRKYIIEYLKDEQNRKKKSLLITTQVVEAGIDIDMDLGFKQQSLIDSDEQLAGRINRNVNKKKCELYLFKQKGLSPKSIYGKDLRYEVTQKLSPDFVKNILTNKEFGELYKKVFQEIKKTNQSAYQKGLNEYLSNFKNFDFREIHQGFKLIDSQNLNIFVPLDIDVLCYKSTDKEGKEKIENNFSPNEIQFIENHNCWAETEKVSGEEIWKLYILFSKDKKKRFSSVFKILNGIMSKFAFSVFSNKIHDLFQFIENPPTSDENQFQTYFKLKKDSLTEIYAEKSGINEKYLEKKTKQTFDFI
jgi:CRISPR-associated endonuclease/helicase Cas3